MSEFQAPPQSYSLGGNFNPNDVEQERVVLVSMILDRSGSTAKFESEFNNAMQLWLKKEQSPQNPIADEMFIQLVTFGTKVTIDSGWRPVVGFNTDQTLFLNSGDYTAGYEAVEVAIKSMLDYGKPLQMVGTDVRYNVCLVTEGEFNEGRGVYDVNGTDPRTGDNVRELLDTIRSNEGLYGKFTMFMYGVGHDVNFEKAAVNMSMDPTAILRTGATAEDFSNMLSNVSRSISKSSSGTAVPNF